jgi:hypothetical protein
MSGYGAPGQFDESELERFQALARARQPDYSAAVSAAGLSMMGAADPSSPYNNNYTRSPAGHPHHAAPYTRVTNPYAGLAEARATYRAPVVVGDHPGPLAQLYAAQQRRQQQQAVQQVVASNYAAVYGAAPAAAGAYGAAAYSVAQQQNAMDQQRYNNNAYGLPTAAPSPGPYARDAFVVASAQEMSQQQQGYMRQQQQEQQQQQQQQQAPPPTAPKSMPARYKSGRTPR